MSDLADASLSVSAGVVLGSSAQLVHSFLHAAAHAPYRVLLPHKCLSQFGLRVLHCVVSCGFACGRVSAGPLVQVSAGVVWRQACTASAWWMYSAQLSLRIRSQRMARLLQGGPLPPAHALQDAGRVLCRAAAGQKRRRSLTDLLQCFCAPAGMLWRQQASAATAELESVQIVADDPANPADPPADQLLCELEQVWHSSILPRLHLSDIGALRATSRSLRAMAQRAPDAVFHAAAERAGLPHTLFLANPGSASQRIHQAAGAHSALRARTLKPAMQCAPSVSRPSGNTGP